MTVKEYYNLLVETSASGGFPALAKSYPIQLKCAYRGKDGKRCAIGVLIPDEEYEASFENKTFSYLLSVGDLKGDSSWIPTKNEIRLTPYELSDVQYIHDEFAFSFEGSCWDHSKFIEMLDKLEIFQNMESEK